MSWARFPTDCLGFADFCFVVAPSEQQPGHRALAKEKGGDREVKFLKRGQLQRNWRQGLVHWAACLGFENSGTTQWTGLGDGCPDPEGPSNHWCQDSGQRVAQTTVSGPLTRALVAQGLEPSVAPTNWWAPAPAQTVAETHRAVRTVSTDCGAARKVGLRIGGPAELPLS